MDRDTWPMILLNPVRTRSYQTFEQVYFQNISQTLDALISLLGRSSSGGLARQEIEVALIY